MNCKDWKLALPQVFLVLDFRPCFFLFAQTLILRGCSHLFSKGRTEKTPSLPCLARVSERAVIHECNTSIGSSFLPLPILPAAAGRDALFRFRETRTLCFKPPCPLRTPPPHALGCFTDFIVTAVPLAVRRVLELAEQVGENSESIAPTSTSVGSSPLLSLRERA